jgi:phospholipase/carboxylesterase
VELKVYTIDGRGEPERLLFLIHGYGANEFHLASYGPLVDPGARFLVAAPRGPLALPPDGACWWDIDVQTFEFDFSLLPSSVAALDRAIDQLCSERRFDRSRAVIGGFSQGAALALALAFRRDAKTRPAAVICLSGFLLGAEQVDWDMAAGASVPVFVGHGTQDPFLGPNRAEEVRERLSEAGASVEFRTYPMAHDISLEELSDLRTWLSSR